MPAPASLKRTPVFEWHESSGSRLVDFAGWELPVQYTGVLEEHRAVRSAAGLFDVSHMGEIFVRGADAAALVQRLTPNDVSKLGCGRAQYSALLTEEGTFIDDLLVYRLGDDELMLVVNAANIDGDLDWIRGQGNGRVVIEDRSDATGLLALQGPRAVDILEGAFEPDCRRLRSFGFVVGRCLGADCLVSRTGYTGEDGFELYLDAADTLQVWEGLLERGESLGLVPVGLAARNTLRLEAGLMLHGSDIDTDTTPFEAGLGWVVKLEKGDFIGRDALLEQRRRGVNRRLVGFELSGRRIARHGATVLAGGESVGEVTSGSWSPTFEKALGLARVRGDLASPGEELEVEIRGKPARGRVVALPFYRSNKEVDD